MHRAAHACFRPRPGAVPVIRSLLHTDRISSLPLTLFLVDIVGTKG
jgi:hypothetical protein